MQFPEGLENTPFKLNLKVSPFYLEKQKRFIPKKNIFLVVPPRYIQKMACAVSIFQKVLDITCKIMPNFTIKYGSREIVKKCLGRITRFFKASGKNF